MLAACGHTDFTMFRYAVDANELGFRTSSEPFSEMYWIPYRTNAELIQKNYFFRTIPDSGRQFCRPLDHCNFKVKIYPVKVSGEIWQMCSRTLFLILVGAPIIKVWRKHKALSGWKAKKGNLLFSEPNYNLIVWQNKNLLRLFSISPPPWQFSLCLWKNTFRQWKMEQTYLPVNEMHEA